MVAVLQKIKSSVLWVGFGITLKGLDTMAWLAGWNLEHSEPRDGDVWASFSGARWLHHLVTCHSYLRKVFLITRNTETVFCSLCQRTLG